MSVTVKLDNPVKIPPIGLDDDILRKLAKVGEGDILNNIKTQQQADGTPLKNNKQLTTERKRQHGRPQLSLVDVERRFAKGRQKSWRHRLLKNGFELQPATAEFDKLIGYVEAMGYTGWRGFSAKGLRSFRQAIKKHVEKILSAM